MRDPNIVLINLIKNAQKEKYLFTDLYRILYNPEFYLKAYAKIQGKEGNMTAGTDGETIDGFNMDRVRKLINSLRDQSYQPKPARRKMIPKKSGGQRPLGIPSFMDKLLQEVLRNILEAIYEGRFSDNSHGFRPEKSCRTLLSRIRLECTGVKWWIEGDIKGFFDNIDHHILIGIFRKRIRDERFLALIWKLLRAGYVEDFVFKESFSGTPQGGILSPLLSNIYLNELDSFMDNMAKSFSIGNERKRNPEWKRLESRRYKLKRKLDEN